MSPSEETVVVGAGLVGLAVAFELAWRGEPVRLVGTPRSGRATQAAAGMLAPLSEADVEHPDQVPFALDSLARYPELVARVEALTGGSCGYREEGLLWVALHRDHLGELDHLLGFMADRGLAAERLGSRALRRLEPRLASQVVGGVHVPQDHQVDPRALARELTAAARRLGLVEEPEAVVEGLEVRGGELRGLRLRDTDSGTRRILPCGRAVLATGAWLGEVVREALPHLGIRPVKGQVLRLKGEPLIEHVVRTPDVYLVPRRDGRLLVGATSEEMGFDDEPTAGGTFELLRRARQVLPDVHDLKIEEIVVGFRPATVDHLPVIGATGVAGLYLAGGHFRNGVLLAAATGWYLAEALTGGDAAALAPFSPRRFDDDERGSVRDVEGVRG